MSQMDMFSSEPLPATEAMVEETAARSSSCPSGLSFQYGFVILFNWNEDVRRPFMIFPRSLFSKDEIQDKTMENRLTDQHRMKKLRPLKPLPDQKMSLFAKVEACKCMILCVREKVLRFDIDSKYDLEQRKFIFFPFFIGIYINDLEQRKFIIFPFFYRYIYVAIFIIYRL